ncbi:MAG: mevalonate kinase [Methanomassiliicoccaceae archaeon]|jgi:mevalonate kinase|nr:mevalonate kinase [Methanomassiliicoccaceae archaeon]
MTATVTATAPGKLIILGEHAVVYGKPAVALAIDRRMRCTLSKASDATVNGRPLDVTKQPYIGNMMRHSPFPIRAETESSIPSGSGLGSSAALSTAFLKALNRLKGDDVDDKRLAEDAFLIEYEAQGRASPLDTSASTHGMGIALNGPEDSGDHLWDISKNGNTWSVRDIKIPKMTLVVGYTGIHAPTGPLVEKVRRYRNKCRFAVDMVNEIGKITLDGINALKKNDLVTLGKLMTDDHKLLSILGVSCNELNKLVNTSLRYSYGAKLTGAGGGGSMIALTDCPEKVCESISMRGGTPFVVRTGEPGAMIEKDRFK